VTTDPATSKPLSIRLLHSLLRSKALRATAALGASGLALACGNLILARLLPEAEFARFALMYSIVMIGISLGPIGADVVLARRKFEPDAKLYRQVLITSALTAAVLAVASGVAYPLRPALLICLFVSIVAGGVRTVAVAHYRSHERFGFALMLTVSTNASVLVASILTLLLHGDSAILPAVAMLASLCLTAMLGWRAIAQPSPGTAAIAGYSWLEGWSAVSFSGAGSILIGLDRLVMPRLLGLEQVATFSVLATIAGSPFQMLQLGVGYTLLPALRNAPSAERRRHLFVHEALVVGGTCLAASITVWLATPFVLAWVLPGRYHISRPLLLAAISVGTLKVLASLVAATVNALGSSGDLVRLSVIGWISIAVALLGATVGAGWGLTGLVCGVGLGWAFRAIVISLLAMPHLRGASINREVK
jgi:O-antigen/teichoic acid export membrane protein